MKIDEGCMNHNAVRLIRDLSIWELCEDTEEDDNLRTMSLGYIRGVCDMADELKKVLNE